MQFYDRDAVAQALHYPLLVDALARGLQEPIEAPPRSHFEPNRDDSTVLIMPAWKARQFMGVKLVSVWPDNHAAGKSAVSAVYLLISCSDGQALAVLDGTELTLRRTAACAALAARILARPKGQDRTLAIVGTGALSVPLAQAHASVMDFDRIVVWGRDQSKAQAAVDRLAALGLTAQAHGDLQDTLAQADVVAAATTAATPFMRSAWVRPGTHLGLMGAFTPAMAEAEPALMARAQVFADNRQAVLDKGGEVKQAIAQGLMAASDIRAELAELVQPNRRSQPGNAHSITVFKSVGFAALDWIAAEMVINRDRSSSMSADKALAGPSL